jgi:Tfp pilus assembly protein PilE
VSDIQHTPGPPGYGEAGFTLVELLVSMLVLMVVSAMVMQGTMDFVRMGDTMTNRANMHAGVRNATVLLQQEVGQAGRISLPGPATLSAAVAPGAATVAVSSASGMFVGQRLVVDAGPAEETVTLTNVDTAGNQISAVFALAHDAGSRVAALGGFSAGVIPTTMASGSTGMVLKILGDINGDGRLVYVEYTCDIAGGRLFRNVMAYDAAVKPPLTVEQVLLTNLLPNPPDLDGTVRPCFTYEERTFGGTTYVIGVAIMTTVRTEARDAVTNDFQRMTKALLNVSPRNVYNVWQLASLGYQTADPPQRAGADSLAQNGVSYAQVRRTRRRGGHGTAHGAAGVFPQLRHDLRGPE